MSRTRLVCAALCAVFVIGVVLGLSGAPLVRARADLAGDVLTEDQRSAMFDELARDVAALEAHGHLLKRVVKLVSPTVVHIEAQKIDPLTSGSRARTIEEAGSGVIYRSAGKDYVLTNRHVIRDAALENIHIHLDDGRQIQPTKVWMDPETDVAVMAVSAPRLVPARLGDSDPVEIGDFVLAVGSPFGLTRSVTYGIISAKGRRQLQLGDDGVRFQDFLQTDAAINPGNSGGPLLNLRGEVIGINTAIASSSGGSEGIGFSIPINMAMVVVRQLIDRGSVARAYLGVSLDRKFSAAQAAEAGLDRLQGARVTAITPESPAEAAGIEVGDIVVRFNGIRVEDDNHLVNIVSLTPVDKEVDVVVWRGGEHVTLKVRVGDRRRFEQRSQSDEPPPPSEPGGDLGLGEVPAWDLQEFGLTVVDLDADVAAALGLDGPLAGLVVTAVDPQGPSAGRIQTGEIIDRVADRPVANVAELERVLADEDWERGVELHVVPGAGGRQRPRTLTVRPVVEHAR